MLALWSVCALSIFAVTLGYQVRQASALARRLDERAELRLIADAGIRRAAALLISEQSKGYDTLSDSWSNETAYFKDIVTGHGTYSVCYNHLDEMNNKAVERYGMVDEESKINVNKADHTVIGRLFRNIDLGSADPQELAASVVDWRDTDSQLSVPLGSAEDMYYQGLKYPYEAKDADYEAPDELLLVKGLTKEVYEKMIGYVTIYGSGKVNVNTASRPVLLAVGVTGESADNIMRFRAGKDGVLGTADDNVFDNSMGIVERLGQAFKMSQGDIDRLSATADQYLTQSSTVFRAVSVGRLKGRRESARAAAVIDRKGNILYWQES